MTALTANPRISVGLALVMFVCVLAPNTRGQSLPPGLIDVEVATGFASLTSLSQFPDGRFLVTDQVGALHLVVGGQRAVIGQIAGLRLGAEAGLLGAAVSPRFPASPFIFAAYNHRASQSLRIARVRLDGELDDPSSLGLSVAAIEPILQVPMPANPAHCGATLRFTADGTLLASIGDAGQACAAQDLSGDLRGRLLRLEVRGLPPVLTALPSLTALVPRDPHFAGPTVQAQLTQAYGLRNPFKFHVDSKSGDVLLADVGEILAEEINACRGGENFGWPLFEGTFAGPGGCASAPANLTGPAYEYDRSVVPALASMVTVGIYRGPYPSPEALGPEYEGSLFFSDLFAGFLRRMVRDSSGAWVLAAPLTGQAGQSDWALGLSDIGGGMIAQDGSLYYLSRPGSLRRIYRPAAPGRVARVAGDMQLGISGQELRQPLVVRVEDADGDRRVGVPVTFAAPAGGTFAQNPVTTDALGQASVRYTLPPGYTGRPVAITARVAEGASTSFTATWRGLLSRGSVLTAAGTLIHLGFIHSERNSPFTLAFEFGNPAPMATSFGTIVTGLFNPTPSTVILDGLGLVGAPMPGMRTRIDAPFIEAGVPTSPAVSGMSAVVQAYALDYSRLPGPDAVVITPPITLRFP